MSSMDTGGAETFLMKIYRSMDKLQYQMDFIAVTDKEGYYDKEIRLLGGEVYNVPLHTKNPLKTFIAIKHIVEAGKYEYVLKILASPVGCFDLLAAKAGGARILCARSTNSTDKESLKSKIVNASLRPLLNHLSTVKLAPSDLAARYTFGDKVYERNEVKMLHNALDLNIYRYSDNERQRIRGSLGLGDAFVVGHIGRFVQQKNHKFLLKVFKELKSQMRDAKLVLVGTGKLQDEVRNYCFDLGIQDDVIFTGTRNDIPSLLSTFDVFCLPSLYEGMPNTCIEAQASGLPCLIADTITRQADITGNVVYLPIEQGVSLWVDEIMKPREIDRIDVNKKLSGSDYDIKKEIDNFINIVFQ